MDERKKCGVATAERGAHRSAASSAFQHLCLHFRDAFFLHCCHFLSLLYISFPLLVVLILFLCICPWKTQLHLLIQFHFHVALLVLKMGFSCRCFLGSCSLFDFCLQSSSFIASSVPAAVQISLHRLCIFLDSSCLIFLDSSCCLVFAGSHHAVLPPDVRLSCHRPAPQPSFSLQKKNKKRMTTLEETESLNPFVPHPPVSKNSIFCGRVGCWTDVRAELHLHNCKKENVKNSHFQMQTSEPERA